MASRQANRPGHWIIRPISELPAAGTTAPSAALPSRPEMRLPQRCTKPDRLRSWGSAMLWSFTAGWPWLQEAEGAGMLVTSGEVEVETVPSVLSASTLIGTKVQSPRGDDLGRIEDLILDQGRGCVACAVMLSGGFLWPGDKRLAIRWHALEVDSRKQWFVLDIDREMVERAPGFKGECRFDRIDIEK